MISGHGTSASMAVCRHEPRLPPQTHARCKGSPLSCSGPAMGNQLRPVPCQATRRRGCLQTCNWFTASSGCKPAKAKLSFSLYWYNYRLERKQVFFRPSNLVIYQSVLASLLMSNSFCVVIDWPHLALLIHPVPTGNNYSALKVIATSMQLHIFAFSVHFPIFLACFNKQNNS